MNLPSSLISNAPGPNVDIRDPRIRITFADVAMKLAHDGPMYGVIVLVGILALQHNIDGLHAIMGAAFALQARSRPPETDKLDKLTRSGMAGIAVIAIALGAAGHFVACTP